MNALERKYKINRNTFTAIFNACMNDNTYFNEYGDKLEIDPKMEIKTLPLNTYEEYVFSNEQEAWDYFTKQTLPVQIQSASGSIYLEGD